MSSFGLGSAAYAKQFWMESADGRVHFVIPKLFEASMCLKGAQKDEGWFFVDIEFLFTVGGDPTGMQGS